MAFATTLVLTGCADADADSGERKATHSALLVTLDTTRYDALSCNGAPPGVTPNLDRLAREGVLFERAYTTAPLTLPAHASMLTGLYPPRHSLRTNGQGRLPRAAPFVAQAAQDAGCQTAAFVSAVVLGGAFGLERGFDLYDAPRHDAEKRTTFFSERASRATVAAARAWLAQRDRARPFFLWVHLWDPHAPLDPPSEFRGTTPNAYLDEVASVDASFGQLIEGLRADGSIEHTTIVVVGDHGEAFGEHGELSHGTYCFETTLRVPLILRRPNARGAGERATTIVSVADVAPTLAEALGVSLGDELDGTSFLEERASDRGAYFESYYGFFNYDWNPIAGWIDARGKYLHTSTPSFFDVRADPGEARDLAAERGPALDPYRAAIDDVVARHTYADVAQEQVDPELRSALQKLGYATVEVAPSAIPHPLAPSSRPNPMERTRENARIIQALELLNEGRYADAERIYADVLSGNPTNFEALERIAFCQLRQLRFDDAIASFRRAIDAGRASANAVTYLGVCMRATGHDDDALELYARAVRMNPSETEALWQMIDLLDHLGRADEARTVRAKLDALTGR